MKKLWTTSKKKCGQNQKKKLCTKSEENTVDKTRKKRGQNQKKKPRTKPDKNRGEKSEEKSRET